MSGVSGLKDEFFICVECAHERGYLYTDNKDKPQRHGKCDACGKSSFVFNLEDLEHVIKGLKGKT